MYKKKRSFRAKDQMAVFKSYKKRKETSVGKTTVTQEVCCRKIEYANIAFFSPESENPLVSFSLWRWITMLKR